MQVEVVLLSADLEILGSTLVSGVATGGRIYPSGPVRVPVTTSGRVAYARGRLLELETTCRFNLTDSCPVRLGDTVTVEWPAGPMMTVSETCDGQ